VDVVGHPTNRQPVESPLLGLLVEQHIPGERVRIEEVREQPDDVGEVDELIVEGPFRDVAGNPYTERKVGRAVFLHRRL
jgi:hypothetical protein